jgi:hypothetical protein
MHRQCELQQDNMHRQCEFQQDKNA